MRQFVAGMMMVGVVVAFSAPAFAKTETIKGQVVDQQCYLMDSANNKGVDHKMPKDVKDCAIGCAKKGQPLALLTSDGKLYTIAGGLAANNNAKLVPHISHTVEITGDVSEKDGKMEIASDKLTMLKK